MTTSLASLPRSVRRHGLLVLLATTFLMWAGFFMIVPILSVHFVDDLGWAAASIGNLIAAANQSTVIAGMAQPDARGSYFGVSAIALAVGGGLGNLVGSALYGASTTNGMPAVPWLIIGGVGAISTAGLWLLNRRQVVKAVAPEDMVLE